jgi:peroxiredoxin
VSTSGGRRLALGGAVALAFAAIGAWVGWRRTEPNAADATAVSILFAQTLPDSEGRMRPLADLRGRPIVVNFWATWCPPCVEEMPELSSLHRDISGGGAQIIGIGIDSAVNIAQFARKSPVSYPLLVAGLGGTELARQFGNQASVLPFTVVVDGQGRVVERVVGRVDIARLRSQLQRMQPAGRS